MNRTIASDANNNNICIWSSNKMTTRQYPNIRSSHSYFRLKREFWVFHILSLPLEISIARPID